MHVRYRKLFAGGLLLLAIYAQAQQPPSELLTISAKELPKASLWEPYTFQLQASGGISPYHWRVISGSLPHGLRLRDPGELAGIPDEVAQFEFNVLVTDKSSPPQPQKPKVILAKEMPPHPELGRQAL